MELVLAAGRRHAGVEDRPIRHFQVQVAQVPVGEGDAGVALEFAALAQADVKGEPVGMGARQGGRLAAVGDDFGREAFCAGEEAEALGGFKALGGARRRSRGVARDEAEVVGGVRGEARDRRPGFFFA